MSTLILTPDRCAPVGSFSIGSTAYAYADQPVRYRGELVTPSPIQISADSNGEMQLLLMANKHVDFAHQFTYTVAAFDPEGSRLWIANIVMPDEDILVWDLIPEPVDLDAQIHVPRVCTNESIEEE